MLRADFSRTNALSVACFSNYSFQSQLRQAITTIAFAHNSRDQDCEALYKPLGAPSGLGGTDIGRNVLSMSRFHSSIIIGVSTFFTILTLFCVLLCLFFFYFACACAFLLFMFANALYCGQPAKHHSLATKCGCVLTTASFTTGLKTTYTQNEAL